ncbi:hypothetical protein D3870_21095 [Noviherbaspirillum cavernae]|uniref:Uncharacterized protein n=2 Tax=Noviherbaspirillum cavernae TaxID=2320862 RepID=A0A418WW51_9BURK|nr:hypothetical protein D3870_21095 [Noviherbaspirillum cavernae]
MTVHACGDQKYQSINRDMEVNMGAGVSLGLTKAAEMAAHGVEAKSLADAVMRMETNRVMANMKGAAKISGDANSIGV